jgi:peptidoglycan/LPS O-acetylase OafA/YrhL
MGGNKSRRQGATDMNANRNPGLDIVRALAVLTVVISTEPLS